VLKKLKQEVLGSVLFTSREMVYWQALKSKEVEIREQGLDKTLF